MKILKCFLLGFFFAMLFFSVSSTSCTSPSPVPCCGWPVQDDHIFQRYLTSTDSIVFSGDEQPWFEKLQLGIEKDDIVNNLGFVISLSGNSVGHSAEERKTEKYKELSKAYGDTLFLGSEVRYYHFFGLVPLDPIMEISVKSLTSYREHSSIDTLVEVTWEGVKKSVLRKQNFSKTGAAGEYVLNFEALTYEDFRAGTRKSSGEHKQKYPYQLKNDFLKTDILVYPESLSFSLRVPPYKSGNYEFEIIGTTKSGKVLKTKTEPIYLVGENE